MPHVMIRLTCPPSIPVQELINFLSKFGHKKDCIKYTLGVEELDKLGIPCKNLGKHIHFHFITDKDIKKDTYQRDFRKDYKDEFKIDLKGNKMYMIKVRNDADSEERWMRYPLKQQKDLENYNYYNYGREEIYLMWKCAHDEYIRQVETNNKSLDKYLDKSSFKGKCYIELKAKGINDKKSFIIAFVKYYLEKSKVPPISKLNDYWIDFQLSVGIMTVEEWYALTYE